MSNLIKVLAHIKLVPTSIGRKTAFSNGYRPLFDFKGANTKISGKIDLIGMKSFEPNTEADVHISFIKGAIDDNHFRTRNKFKFTEGLHPIGEGEILEIIER